MCIVSIEWAHSYLKFKRYVINGCAVCCDPFFCAARCPYRFRSHSLLFFANTGVREGDVTRDNCPLCKHVQIWYLATLDRLAFAVYNCVVFGAYPLYAANAKRPNKGT